MVGVKLPAEDEHHDRVQEENNRARIERTQNGHETRRRPYFLAQS